MGIAKPDTVMICITRQILFLCTVSHCWCYVSVFGYLDYFRVHRVYITCNYKLYSGMWSYQWYQLQNSQSGHILHEPIHK